MALTALEIQITNEENKQLHGLQLQHLCLIFSIRLSAEVCLSLISE